MEPIVELSEEYRLENEESSLSFVQETLFDDSWGESGTEETVRGRDGTRLRSEEAMAMQKVMDGRAMVPFMSKKIRKVNRQIFQKMQSSFVSSIR